DITPVFLLTVGVIVGVPNLDTGFCTLPIDDTPLFIVEPILPNVLPRLDEPNVGIDGLLICITGLEPAGTVKADRNA
ncbi:hypothetical protein ABK046_52955, partial [Streptomyces caeruleatus]